VTDLSHDYDVAVVPLVEPTYQRPAATIKNSHATIESANPAPYVVTLCFVPVYAAQASSAQNAHTMSRTNVAFDNACFPPNSTKQIIITAAAEPKMARMMNACVARRLLHSAVVPMHFGLFSHFSPAPKSPHVLKAQRARMLPIGNTRRCNEENKGHSR